ncbi:precorrin-2 C(20)-methyltransferase [Synechocystis sp. LKSZ1]|uniref:precorrin-2 C(20)-methyltransferase n=1 Tax=Synechocystis sp. LKSZ1 TaxID=3144951 RepID=UPI00336BF51B
MQKLGILWGVSVGTGDPELLTLKALNCLQRVPVVAFPAGLRGQPGIAEEIIRPYLQPEQITLALTFPYVLDTDVLAQAWQRAAATVWDYLRQGRDVAFACEGDISFYSTFTYLAQTLQAQHPEVLIQRIPGVSSPMVAASVLGLPLTMQDQRLAVLPALYHPQELEQALDWADVIVLMKVRLVYGQVWSILAARELLGQAWLVERASTPGEKIYHPLDGYPELTLSYFSLLIIQNPRH